MTTLGACGTEHSTLAPGGADAGAISPDGGATGPGDAVPDSGGDAVLDSGGDAAVDGGPLGPAPRTVVVGYTGSSTAPGFSRNDGLLNIGRQFRVTQPGIVVRELGFWDLGQDGLAKPHAVTLFALDQAGPGAHATPVAGGSVVVPAGTIAALDQGFRFAPLAAPLALPVGTYAVVGYAFDAVDAYGEAGNLPPTSTGVADAQFDPYQFTGDASPAFPSGGDANNHTSVSLRYETGVPAFIRIMPLGDSITAGIGGSNAGYRSALAELLSSSGMAFQLVGSSTDVPGTLPADQLHHEGHPGWVVYSGTSGRDGIGDHLDAWLGPAGVAPDVILLMIGTNDVDIAYDLAGLPSRLDGLITRITRASDGLRPNARLVVAQITRIADATEDARAQAYNAKIAELVASHRAAGEKVSLVDMHAALEASDFSDKLHPNDSGYRKMAQAWFAALQ